jgi:hypothetical protein
MYLDITGSLRTNGKTYNSMSHLRSRTDSPDFLISYPEVFQKSSHFSIESLVSDERPIAFRKSVGVEITSAGQ